MRSPSTVDKPQVNRQGNRTQIGVKAPTKIEYYLMKGLIILGVISAGNFLLWFFDQKHTGFYPLFILLSFSISYKFLRVFFEWYHYWAIGIKTTPQIHKEWRVDMLTTAVPEEPFEMIKKSLIAMKNVRYPHITYLCDEGNNEQLRQLCRDLDVIYVTRSEKKDAKAGNINNALRLASGEICVILDPDHEPSPDFLEHVLPYFSDSKVGFVQIVQAYGNSDESMIAKGAAQQTYAFYGPMMMGMNSYGTVQALGANCTFRRKALDSIGGHAAGLAEDMHTAMRLHAKGWNSVYVPKILARGLVPSTLPAYYKQQLKWSRGTFELLLTVFPFLYSSFSWRQKIHYLLLPLHFAFGLFVFVDILVPVTSLLTGFSPLHIDLSSFLYAAVPFGVSVLFIRQYAQKWLLEKHELGLHIIGGAVLTGTWWVHLLGLVYTLLRIKVPYIATPKDDKPTNNWILSLPNIVVCIVCLGAILYGLYYDWNPYSFLMAGYALINLLLLSAVIFLGQHDLINKINNTIIKFGDFYMFLAALRQENNKLVLCFYALLRNGAPVFVLFVFIFCQSYPLIRNGIYNDNDVQGISNLKFTGGFYTGAYIPTVQKTNSLDTYEDFQQAINSNLNIVSIYQYWGTESLEKFPIELLNEVAEKGGIPMITWEPYVSSFPERADSPELRYEKKGMAAIAAGKFDDYIKAYALKIRSYNYPVFIRFGHEADNPAYPWSATGENTSEEYKSAWRQVVSVFAALGVSNVTWVWTPWAYDTFDQYYPGDQFVDWIGITCLNYGNASVDGKWMTFDEIYRPFRKYLIKTNKPVMLAEFGSTNYGGDATEWLKSSFNSIKSYREIKSLIFFNSNQDSNWITEWRPSSSTLKIDWTVKTLPSISKDFAYLSTGKPAWLMEKYLLDSVNLKKRDYSKRNVASIKGQPGNYCLLVDGKNFYIKGVAYNAMHEWRDGHYPNTRKQLERDFQAIKDMGANTIRRYHPSVYDRNILSVAEENKLKVLYGFWFDPEIDYYKDTAKVQEYINLVEQKVIQYKDSPTVLAWVVGNETSGLLKKHFDQPYLYVVREAYMRMIELIAQRIHELDSNRVVVTSLEHSWQLPGELYAFRQVAPSVDVIGINSYYDQQIGVLKKLTDHFDNTRPYLVSEFGPKGYWNPELTTVDKNGALIEDDDLDKAAVYSKEWREYIYANKGYNIGGVAFSWRDRYEGTATWFGLTDFKDRKKPAFYALQRVWTDNNFTPELPKVTIIGPSFKLLPNNKYEFTALQNGHLPLSYEWKVYNEDVLQEVGKIEPTKSSNIIQVVLPKNVERCRLYLYAYDTYGNVVTASKPITVFQY